MRVLLVEDDMMIGESLREALRRQGMACDWVRDGRAAEAVLGSERFDAVLLDLGLPQRDGLEVLKGLRGRGDATPVIVLTARDALPDKVKGLDTGADDYLVKPFELDELLARLRAVRRRQGGRGSPLLQVADLTLDPATREVKRGGRPVLLSAREFAVLQALLERRRRLVPAPRRHGLVHRQGRDHPGPARRRDPRRLRARSGRALRGAGGRAGPPRLHAHRRRRHAGAEGGAQEALAGGGEGRPARGRAHHRQAHPRPGERRGDRRAQGGGRERLVRGAPVGARGRLQGPLPAAAPPP